MEINNKLLEKLAQLSALHLSEEEKRDMRQYLQETLSHFEKIRKIDTKNIPALVSPLKPPLLFRKDQVQNFPEKEKLLSQAHTKQGALVKTPPAVE